MSKSSGVPIFNGMVMAHNARITGMSGTVQPIIKVYPRNIGAVIKCGGIVEKTMSVDCRMISPPTTSRAELEDFMNRYNEKFGPVKGTLFIDDNHYKDCAINSIKYSTDITSGYLVASVEFNLGVQTETDAPAQLVPGKLFANINGRPGKFTVTDGEGVDGTSKVFNIWHNMDITKDLENRLVMEIYDIHHKDRTIKINGGVETITAYCWMIAEKSEQEDGWLQTVGAYMYDMINGPLGSMGTLELGGKVMTNCLWTQVKLTETSPTGARYELTFVTSLQC